MVRMFAAVSGLALLAGCTSEPVLNVRDAPVGSGAAGAVEAAIASSLAREGWEELDRTPGQIDAALASNGHRAQIAITYTDTAYSIVYRDSDNFDYANGHIGHLYNVWIDHLNADIQSDLAALGGALEPGAHGMIDQGDLAEAEALADQEARDRARARQQAQQHR